LAYLTSFLHCSKLHNDRFTHYRSLGGYKNRMQTLVDWEIRGVHVRSVFIRKIFALVGNSHNIACPNTNRKLCRNYPLNRYTKVGYRILHVFFNLSIYLYTALIHARNGTKTASLQISFITLL